MSNKINNYIESLSEPKKFKSVVYLCGALFIAFFVFQAGMVVGFHKASFRHDWDGNFSNNFGPMHRGGMMSGFPENFPNSHGAIGKIIKVELPTLIIEDKDNVEKIVLITDNTLIRNMRLVATVNDLKVDSSVVVIGSPNAQGQIEAKLIRILPLPIITPTSITQ